MADAMLQGLLGMISPICIFLMFAGVAVGVIFGAIPGLTGGIAIAILLPVTFYLDPLPSMALLIGVYVGGSFGGSIPAILFGTPGAPEAGITVFDGYPMAKKGQSGKALKTALYASAAGNFISSLITIVMIMGVAKLALMMGPSEYFTVVVFSIVLIATVGSKSSWVKGLLAVFIGLFFSFVGGDPVTGIPRFTFGVRDLLGGIQLIPVLVGLFVGAELLENVRMANQNQKLTEQHKEQNKITKEEIKSCLPGVLSGALIGSVIGALPGLNAAISATLNYAAAKKFSKHPEEFGNGSIEGIAAAESANNGTVGPTLVPLLTLGIPGSGTAAIFLGALMIQGVTPGPTIFRDSADVVYGVFFALMFCTIVLALIGRAVIGAAQFISYIPTELVNPVIILTCCAGAFSVNGRIFDVYVLLFFMVVGFMMRVIKLPVLPLLISFLLGSMMESNFRRALQISKGSLSTFVGSPVCVFFLAVTVLLLVYSILEPVLKKRKAQKEAS